MESEMGQEEGKGLLKSGNKLHTLRLDQGLGDRGSPEIDPKTEDLLPRRNNQDDEPKEEVQQWHGRILSPWALSRRGIAGPSCLQ